MKKMPYLYSKVGRFFYIRISAIMMIQRGEDCENRNQKTIYKKINKSKNDRSNEKKG